jgi:Cu/Ag efflux pump CusA
VLAIAARSGILLIRHYQRLEQQEGEAFGPGLVLRGSQQRFGPTVMSILATALGPVTADDRRHHRRPRDRAAPGHHHSGRPGHRAAARPVRPAHHLPALRDQISTRQAAQRRLLVLSSVAVAGILLLLQKAFGSWRLALLAILTLPMALVGGILAASLGGGILSLGSLVGFLTVLGIAARNGILLINHFQHLERHEGESFGPALVLRGARERLSPILMTSLATGLALVPLVVAGTIPGNEIEHPMAVVILGGLVTSTLLNLFVVPSLYLRFGGRRDSSTPGPSAAPRSV